MTTSTPQQARQDARERLALARVVSDFLARRGLPMSVGLVAGLINDEDCDAEFECRALMIDVELAEAIANRVAEHPSILTSK